MMTKKTIVLYALALLMAAPAAFAQSPLADAARREAERRKDMGTPARVAVYTNEDLARLPVRAAPARPVLPPTQVTTIGPLSPDPAPPGVAEAPAGGAEPAGPRDEKYWRDRVTAARSHVSRLEMFVEALQSRINALSADFVNRDDPAQRQKIAEDRQRALEELDRVTQEIKDATRAIADIQEEARRLGVPAGWVR
jgi:hypothetical protein